MWMKFARTLGRIQTAILLFLIYFLGVGLVAVISFMFRKDFLDENMRIKGPTLWRPRETPGADIENAKRQF